MSISAHWRHLVAPGVITYCPAGQDRHEPSPPTFVVPKVPLGHGTHGAALSTADVWKYACERCLPAGQCVVGAGERGAGVGVGVGAGEGLAVGAGVGAGVLDTGQPLLGHTLQGSIAGLPGS